MAFVVTGRYALLCYTQKRPLLAYSLFKVFNGKMIIGIHIAVMCTGFVFQRILDELETRNTHGIKTDMVGTARIAERYAAIGTLICKKSQPGFKISLTASLPCV